MDRGRLIVEHRGGRAQVVVRHVNEARNHRLEPRGAHLAAKAPLLAVLVALPDPIVRNAAHADAFQNQGRHGPAFDNRPGSHAGPGGDLHAGRVCAGGELDTSAAERFQLPVVERRAGNCDVVSVVAVLAFGERLDDLRRRQLVGYGGEIDGVSARRVASRERQCSDSVDKIICGRIHVQW